MKKLNWKISLGFFLIVLSGLLYSLHYVVFHDVHHIFIYLIGDIAFVPIEVLFVTLILHRVLTEREKKNILNQKVKTKLKTVQKNSNLELIPTVAMN